MNQELSFETIPFEIAPEFQGEVYEEEGERGAHRPSAAGRSRYSRSNPQPGRRSKGTKRPPVPKPRPIPRGPRRPWEVIREPYGLVSEPYPGEPEPSGSERVRWVQDCLNQAMGLQIPVTGIMGAETRSAVRSFQKQQGLRASGIVGPDTEEALKAACGGKSAAVGDNTDNPQETELGPITTTLTWQENPSNPSNPLLFTREQTCAVKSGGVYIAMDTSSTPNKILKVGETTSFKTNPCNDQRYRDLARRIPGLKFYVATYSGGRGSPGYNKMIEKAISRLLYRAGKSLPEDKKPFVGQKVLGNVKIRNILPPPLQALIPSAYLASAGLDKRGNAITPRTRNTPLPRDTGLLSIPPRSYPTWEVTLAEELTWGEAEFPGFGEVYGETFYQSPFSEAEEIELAAELLSISSEEELDQFLGKLIKGAWKGIKKVGKFVGKIAKPLGGVLKGVAKAALPFVGGALGSFIPIPGVGTALGSALGGALSKALELEYGELEQEEQELEMARRFVRIAGTAARQAAMADPNADSQTAAKAAVMTAARQHVPNLLVSVTGDGLTTSSATGYARTGRWVRQGRAIVVLGA